MKVFKFQAVLKHDNGHAIVSTWATNVERAAQIIMAVELCPRSSIVSICKVVA